MKWESNEVTFQILEEDDPAHGANAGDLIITLQPSDVHIPPDGHPIFIEGGYHMIADMMQRRHSNEPSRTWASELADLFEGILCNSDWDWVPGDEDMALSNNYAMYIDGHGEIQILLRYWQFDRQVFDDPIETLFCKGYIVFTGHDNDPDMDTPDYLLDLFRNGSLHFEDAWKVWEAAGKPTFEATREL